jgi:Family of unknown function (DUF6512)
MNEPKSTSIFHYELVGMIFIIILGSILHFTFDFLGQNPVVGVFSAVNESVWEHLKLAFWPAMLFMLLEYRPLRKSANNYFLAKMLGVCLMIILIPIIFYSYTAITGKSIFVIDISTFVIAVVIGQVLSFKLLIYKKLSQNYDRLSIVGLILLAAIFALFTFFPPHLLIFRDPLTQNYGIPTK